MKKILLSISVALFLFSTQLSALSLVHYWNFNGTNVPVNGGAKGSAIDVTTLPFTSILADSTIKNNPASLVYQAIPGTASPYSTFWDTTIGDSGNAINNDVAGNCLRLGNPADQMQLVFKIPSSGYCNITISYDLQRSSAGNGALTNTFYYSVDNGAVWKNSTTNSGLISKDTIQSSPNWTVKSVTITDLAANNNPNLKFKILFTGGQNVGTSGNNRIDNITVEGDALTSAIGETKMNKILMYPNPCKTGKVNFSDDVNVEVFDMMGKQIKTVGKSNKLNTTDLFKGVYLVRLNGVSTQKLVVE